MRPAALILLSLIACKGGDKSRRPWPELVKEAAPGLAKQKPRIAAAKAELDKNLDASTYPACTPGATYTYAPYGGATHDIDFVDYATLPTGQVDEKSVIREVVGSGSVSWAIAPDNPWTPSDLMAERSAAELVSAQTIKTLVIAKARPDATSTAIALDVFVVALEPPRVICAVAGIGAKGTRTGTEEKEMVETTTRRDTGVVLKTRAYTEGGYQTSDATNDARNEFNHRVYEALHVVPVSCSDEDIEQDKHRSSLTSSTCMSYPMSRCEAHACRYDPDFANYRAADRAKAVKIFDASKPAAIECKRLNDAKGYESESPYNKCKNKLQQDRAGEGEKVGLSRLDMNSFHEDWEKTSQLP